MTPKFAQAVDPILLHVLELLERIARDEKPVAQEERLRIRALIDQAGAVVGAGNEWDLARYALVAWIDEVLVETPWDGRDWWSNNVLEVELFNTRECFEQFYVRAQEASTLTRRDALEVYYVCVVLGFRGLYRDPQEAGFFIQSHGLPAELETWAKQASLAIRLGQGRPGLPVPRRQIAGAPPLKSRPWAAWSWIAAALLLLSVAVYYGLFFTA